MSSCSQYRLTADKREIKDFPKLPSCLRAPGWLADRDTHRQAATSFIRGTLGETVAQLKRSTEMVDYVN